MGIGDMFKKAVEKGLSYAESKGIVAKSAETQAAEYAAKAQEKKAEEERLAAESEQREQEELAKKREEIRRKKEEILAEMAISSCEKGDCLWNKGEFYFSCDPGVVCPKGCPRKFNGCYEWTYAPELWPFMKWFERVEKLDVGSEERFSEGVWLVSELLDKYMPKLKPYNWIVTSQFVENGVNFSNRVFELLWKLKDIDLTEHMVKVLVEGKLGTRLLKLNESVYENISLYQRTDEEFDYTVQVFDIVLDEGKLSAYYAPDSVNVNDLFDAEGNIKPAGIKDWDCDGIWRAIECWESV